jgi:hypothetical protein
MRATIAVQRATSASIGPIAPRMRPAVSSAPAGPGAFSPSVASV